MERGLNSGEFGFHSLFAGAGARLANLREESGSGWDGVFTTFLPWGVGEWFGFLRGGGFHFCSFWAVWITQGTLPSRRRDTLLDLFEEDANMAPADMAPIPVTPLDARLNQSIPKSLRS